MPRTPLERLKRKRVEVRANGLTYRGILLEATETEMTLRGETGFITLPMDRIASVRDPSAPLKKEELRFVDSSFYAADTPANLTVPASPSEVSVKPETTPASPLDEDPKKQN
ncbi:MAG TPA: hypothetical protein VI895_05035 [Bdellovibrionota bacterium]|nr:hypothetical protein [Bdellovibrionota bacterium]